MMSQGTAGDLHWMDYSQPATNITIETYSNEVAEVAFRAYNRSSITIGYRWRWPSRS